MSPWCYQAFGVQLSSAFPLPGLAPTDPADVGKPLRMCVVAPDELESAWSGSAESDQPRYLSCEGRTITIVRGAAGDHRIEFGLEGAFHLDPHAESLLCGAVNHHDPSWFRFLSDTVLWYVAGIRGFATLHASAVELDGGLVAIAGGTGGGKSTLATELVSRGGRLFSDDVVSFDKAAGKLWCHPGPPLMNIPLDLLSPAFPGSRGTLLAVLGGEGWLALTDAVRGPRQMRAICMLERGPESRLEATSSPATALTLIGRSIGVPVDAATERRRFELFSDMADSVPVLTIKAPLEATAADVAGLLERSLAGLRLPMEATR